jgi:hypothetical protein
MQPRSSHLLFLFVSHVSSYPSNLSYYQANYLLVILVLLVLTCFWVPVFLFGLALIIGSAIYLFSVRKTPLVVGEKVLTKKEVMLSYGVLSLLTCLLFGGARSILALAIAALIILLHSSFRQRSLKSKVNVGLISLLSGGKSSEDGPDDLAGSQENGDDVENPTPGGSNRGGGEDLSRLQSNDALAKEQQAVRAQFRANMRNKYLKK